MGYASTGDLTLDSELRITAGLARALEMATRQFVRTVETLLPDNPNGPALIDLACVVSDRLLDIVSGLKNGDYAPECVGDDGAPKGGRPEFRKPDATGDQTRS